MADVALIVKMPEEAYNLLKTSGVDWLGAEHILNAVANGIQLPKGHGKIIDISKIDDDRIDGNNPVISLTINGEYIEAVSLDYLNSLTVIIEADKESENKE